MTSTGSEDEAISVGDGKSVEQRAEGAGIVCCLRGRAARTVELGANRDQWSDLAVGDVRHRDAAGHHARPHQWRGTLVGRAGEQPLTARMPDPAGLNSKPLIRAGRRTGTLWRWCSRCISPLAHANQLWEAMGSYFYELQWAP